MNWRITISCALTLAIALPLTSQAAPKVKRKASSSAYGVDPNAKKVDLFKAVTDNQVKMDVTVQGRAAGVLTLTNVSKSNESLNVQVPLAMGATPNAPAGAIRPYYLTAFGTPGAPQSLVVAVSPQWTAGVDKKSGSRKTNVKTVKKGKAADDADEKKGDDKDAKKDDAKKDEAKKEEAAQGDSLVANVPLPPGAIQTLPLYTLGLNMQQPQALYGPFTPAELDKVTQAPEMKKVLEHMVQGHFTEDVAQTLAWYYNERKGWEEMSKFLTPIQIQLAQQAAEVVEGRASPEAATATTTGKKKKSSSN